MLFIFSFLQNPFGHFDNMASNVVTRLETDIWLVGQQIDVFTGRKLPSNGDVLRRLFHFIRSQNNTLRQAARNVFTELKLLWEQARIPTIADYNGVNKIEKTYNDWRALNKSKTRRSETQVRNEEAFKQLLPDLFDIAHSDALEMISIQDDKDFLLAQREKGRRGYMAGIDKILAKKEIQKQQKIEAFEHLRQKDRKKREQLFAQVELCSSNNSTEDESEPVSETALLVSRKRRRATRNIISPELVASLDRNQVSDRKAVHVLSAAAASLGQNIEEIAVNRSTIRRARIKIRKQVADELKKSFACYVGLTVHWDGKLLPDVTGMEKVDRLAVIVSGSSVKKLLGVPKILSGTGRAMSDAVIECLDDWGIREHIAALCFDTTASNTGPKLGACTAIEEKLGREVLWFACRHHVLEIVAECAFTTCYKSASTGPDIKLFQRFKQQWRSIRIEEYSTVDHTVRDQDDIIAFCKDHLRKIQPRDDYRELLELTIIYLGGMPERGIHFQQPGALHRARWMARIIYAIKICLFHSQFKMTRSEEAAMKRFAVFVVSTYIQFWYLAPLPASAPASDLKLMKMLVSYEDKDLSQSAIKAFLRHQWYISETLVSMSFFDDETSLEVKREMVKALTKEGAEKPLKRLTIVDQQQFASTIQEKTVANFVTHASLSFFEILHLPTDFLHTDPEEWNARGDYQAAKSVVHKLQVVNDIAERGVSLMQTFNSILTKNEDQKQYILQVVEEHRKKFPNASKAAITSQFSQ